MVREHVDPTETEPVQVVAVIVAVPGDVVFVPEMEDATVVPAKFRGKSPSLISVAVIA
jgi:hypothetical protein